MKVKRETHEAASLLTYTASLLVNKLPPIFRGCIRHFTLLSSGVWMETMSGSKRLFACEVMVVLLVAAGKDEKMQINKNIYG